MRSRWRSATPALTIFLLVCLDAIMAVRSLTSLYGEPLTRNLSPLNAALLSSSSTISGRRLAHTSSGTILLLVLARGSRMWPTCDSILSSFVHGLSQNRVLYVVPDESVEVGVLRDRQVGVVAHNLVAHRVGRIAVGRVTLVPATSVL